MADILIHTGRDILKDVKSDTFEVPVFEFGAVKFTLEGDDEDKLAKDQILKKQLNDAVNEKADEVADIVKSFLEQQEKKADAIMKTPAGSDFKGKLKDMEDLAEAGNAMLKKAAASIQGGMEDAVQKAWDTYCARQKVKTKYKWKTNFKAAAEAVVLSAAVARAITTAGVDPTAYISIVAALVKISILVKEATKSADDLASELFGMYAKLQANMAEDIKKTAQQVKKEALAASGPSIFDNKASTILTTIAKADQFSAKLTTLDDSCKKMAADTEKGLKKIKELQAKGDAKKVKEINDAVLETSHLLDDIHATQENLKLLWKIHDDIADVLADWQAKRATIANLTPKAITVANIGARIAEGAARIAQLAGAI